VQENLHVKMLLNILNSSTPIYFHSIPNKTLLKTLRNRDMNSRKNALETESHKPYYERNSPKALNAKPQKRVRIHEE
jgi:hypothetical protein